MKTDLADTGAIMQVMYDGTYDPIKGMTVTLKGTDSAFYRKGKLKKEQAIIDRQINSKGKAKIDAEKLYEDSIEDLATMTVSWSGFEEDGKPIECTAKNAARVYEEYSFIKEQVQAFVNERDNFRSKGKK